MPNHNILVWWKRWVLHAGVFCIALSYALINTLVLSRREGEVTREVIGIVVLLMLIAARLSRHPVHIEHFRTSGRLGIKPVEWNPWGRQRLWPALSGVIHLALLIEVSWPILVPPAQPLDPQQEGAVYLVPPRGADGEHKHTDANSEQSLVTPPNEEISALRDIPPDPNDLSITVHRDPTEELQHALKSWGGHLGFGKPDTPLYFQYLVRAADWRRIDSDKNMFALDGFFVLRLTRPEQWKFLGPVRSSNSIPDGLVVYALFPLTFYDEIDAAVREELGLKSQLDKSVPTHIEIVFSPETPLRFRIRILSIRPMALPQSGPGG
jgi:hypothetical protein